MTFSMVNGVINVHFCLLCFNDVVFIANYEAMRKIFRNCFHFHWFVNCNSLFCNATNNDCNEKDLFVSAMRNSQSINYYDFIFVINFNKYYSCSDAILHCRSSHLRSYFTYIYSIQECFDIAEITFDSVSIQCRILIFIDEIIFRPKLNPYRMSIVFCICILTKSIIK